MKAHNADQAGGLESRQKLSFLYLFAGVERKADISCYLHALAARSVAWNCHEVNILSTSDHDLLDQDLQQELLEQVSAGRFSALMVSPPYNTWSRAVWANTLGPRPIRNSLHPLGFPWLSHSNKVKADNANMLVFFAVAVLQAAARARDRGHNVVAMLEHPEDLGQAPAATQQAFGNCHKSAVCDAWVSSRWHSSSAPSAPTTVNPRDCCQMRPMRKALAGKVGR